MKDNKAGTPSTKGTGISIRIIGGLTTLIAVVLAFLAFTLAGRVDAAEASLASYEKHYLECSEAIHDLQMASDYLTSKARTYVVTGRREYLDAYLNEIEVVNRRGKAVDILRTTFTDEDESVMALEEALAASDELAETEFVAMKLAANYYALEDLPARVEETDISPYQHSDGSETALDVATQLILGPSYDEAKESIRSKVEASSNALLEQLDEDLEANQALVQSLLFQLRVAVALLLCVIMVLVLALFMYVLKPLSRYVKRISKSEPLEADGAYELHYLADAYNAMYEDNTKRIEQLRAFAERDPLTGISNRSGYNSFLAKHTRNIALLLIDIDNFKEYNAVYGHDTGDAMLILVAEALSDAFRSTDFPCRIESDRFAVIMTNMSTNLRDAIVHKIERVISYLADDPQELPLVSLSVGAAFSTEGMSDQDIFLAASKALDDAKESESDSIIFYGEHNVS